MSVPSLTPSLSQSPLLWVEPLATLDSATVDGDCDCACSTTPFTVDFTIDSDANFQAVADAYTLDLGTGFHLAFSPFAPAGPVVLNQRAWQRYQEFWQYPQILRDSFDHQLAQQHLITPQGQPPQVQTPPPDRLTVWLHVTNACNLDCPYCYVRKSSAVLERDRGYAILDHLFQLAQDQGFRALKLKYAGGEATLEFDLIQDLHRHAQQLALKTGITLQAVVLSNGTTLNPDLVQWLVENRVRLMVSLDGLGEVHDRQRPHANGQPSFHSIAAKLDRLIRPSAVDLHLSVTVTAANAPYLAETVAWILERDWPFGLNFYRVPPVSSSPESLAALALEEQTLIAGLRSAYQVIEAHLPDRPLFHGLLDKVQTQAHTHTCGVGQSYIVVTHEGRIAQCQMHLDQASAVNLENSGGFQPNSKPSDSKHSDSRHSDSKPSEFTPTNVQDSHRNWLQTVSQGAIQNLSVDEKAGCDRCTYRYRCTGGCPVETFRFTGRWDLKSPHCHIYKTLYPEVLRLEGLRLLKVYGLTA